MNFFSCCITDFYKGFLSVFRKKTANKIEVLVLIGRKLCFFMKFKPKNKQKLYF